MNVIDTHVHIFPEKIAAAAVKATSDFYFDDSIYTPLRYKTDNMPGTAENLLETVKGSDISRMVVFSCATTGHQVESINNFIHRECQLHPEFTGVGTMHIDYPDFEAECDRLLSMGMRGIKLHPDIQHFPVDDERILPLYEIMQSRRMFLISHTGDYRFDYSGPRRMARLAAMFPDMDFICAHFAGWSEWDLAREVMRLDNVYMDTSSTIPFGGPEAAKKAFDAFDNTHIFFGSDYPMLNPVKAIDSIKALGLKDGVLEGVFSKNFEAFEARYL